MRWSASLQLVTSVSPSRPAFGQISCRCGRHVDMKPDPRENDVDTSNRTEPSPYLVHSAHWQHTLALELGTRHSCARYTGDSDRALYYAWCFVIEGICITSTRLPLNLLRSASTGSTTIPTVGAPSFTKFCSTFHKCPSTYNPVALRGWRLP